MKQLRDIARSEGVIATGRTKNKLSQRIQRVCNPSAEQMTQQQLILRVFDETHFTNTPIHHRAYRANFNAVDKHNKLWYQFNYKFRLQNWRAKFVLSLMETAVLNAFVLSNFSRRTDLKDFRNSLVNKLLQIPPSGF